MLVATDVARDARVVREAATLAAAGHQVHVVGRDVPADYQPPAGVSVSSAGGRSALKPKATTEAGVVPTPRRLPPHLRAARWLLLPEHRNQTFRSWARAAYADAAAREFDAVHAHDFTALEAGSRLATERGVPLVYDTHEFWPGRPRVGRPTPGQKWRESRVEAELGHRAAAVVTVGEGVAEALRARYGWPHLKVVRNTFPHTEAAPAAPAPAGLVYAGRIGPYRELEAIVAAARRIDLPVTLAGPADETYLAALDRGPVRVLPALPVPEVDTLLAEAGIALVTHSNRWINHRLALPNKLFHAVRAGVPVVATDVPELRRVVAGHALGALYRAGDADALVKAVAEVRQRYAEYAENVRKAARALSWEADAEVLTGIYRELEAG